MRLISKILLTTLVGVAIYGIVVYGTFRKMVAVSSMLVESAVPYEQKPSRPSRRILVVGDSTGVGVGAGEPRHSLAGMLGASYPDADITNSAVSGSKVRDVPGQLALVKGERCGMREIRW
jgi:hypothetical protein